MRIKVGNQNLWTFTDIFSNFHPVSRRRFNFQKNPIVEPITYRVSSVALNIIHPRTHRGSKHHITPTLCATCVLTPRLGTSHHTPTLCTTFVHTHRDSKHHNITHPRFDLRVFTHTKARNITTSRAHAVCYVCAQAPRLETQGLTQAPIVSMHPRTDKLIEW